MIEKKRAWYIPKIIVPKPKKPKEQPEKTVDDYLGEDNEQNLGDC